MLKYHLFWREVLDQVELLWVVTIPVTFVLKGVMDLATQGQYFWWHYIQLFADITLGSAVCFTLTTALSHWYRHAHPKQK